VSFIRVSETFQNAASALKGRVLAIPDAIQHPRIGLESGKCEAKLAYALRPAQGQQQQQEQQAIARHIDTSHSVHSNEL
jgi:hypothetical protein